MIEKVLGFKPRKAWLIDDEFGEIYSYTIDKSQLVPVVSLEWLKKYYKEETRRPLDICEITALKKLLRAAESQASEKTKQKIIEEEEK
jgi:hypothetical protein